MEVFSDLTLSYECLTVGTSQIKNIYIPKSTACSQALGLLSGAVVDPRTLTEVTFKTKIGHKEAYLNQMPRRS